jgi:hypothetical protein
VPKKARRSMRRRREKRDRADVVVVVVVVIYKDWIFRPVPNPGLVELLPSSLQWLSSLPSFFWVVIKTVSE